MGFLTTIKADYFPSCNVYCKAQSNIIITYANLIVFMAANIVSMS